MLNWASSIIWDGFGFALLRHLIGLQILNHPPHFVFSLALCNIFLSWLVLAITLVLMLRHSIKTRFNRAKEGKTNAVSSTSVFSVENAPLKCTKNPFEGLLILFKYQLNAHQDGLFPSFQLTVRQFLCCNARNVWTQKYEKWIKH